MPQTNYLKIRIGNRDVEVEQSASFPIAINYALEDADKFEQKKGSGAFDVTIPATPNNSQTFNSPHNPGVEDLTADEFFTSPQPCLIEANGVELLNGKAFLKQATHTDRPQAITVNCYGDNADWIIDLKEATLLDFVNPAVHAFTADNIENSWGFSITSETFDYVYAPVRYRKAFLPNGSTADAVITPFEMKPSISVYWILYRAFRSLGYAIRAGGFFDSQYFRRLVMPWTWGSFSLLDETFTAPFKFRAMNTQGEFKGTITGSWNELVSPVSAPVGVVLEWKDKSSGGAQGGFENTAGLYQGPGTTTPVVFPNNHDLNYYYPSTSPLGPVTMNFELQVYVWVSTSGSASQWGLRVRWFVNGGTARFDDLILQHSGAGVNEGNHTINRELDLQPGDIVTAQMHIDAGSGTYSWRIGAPYPAVPASNGFSPSYFRNTYFKKTIGSPINFKQYPAMKNYKFLDLLRGLIDLFNLSVNTDADNKIITIEPTHDYSVNPGLIRPGYFRPERVQWTDKQDLSKESTVELYSDNEREFDFKFKDDGNDGGLQILNKRYSISAGNSRYLFPDRFKSGIKEYTNRFFSPVVHVPRPNWGSITGVVPQLIALIPENISNTSKSEDENIFQPKLAYYKGYVTGAGGWVWQRDPYTPATLSLRTSLPYMFAVNYHPGGETDPVLTYSDQLIPFSGMGGVKGDGLMRRFFLQRLAIMRHGKRYTTWMKLDLKDITNWPHREAIIIGNSTYYLVAIDKYLPLLDETTQVTLWKYWPVMQADSDSCFPSAASVSGSSTTLAPSDLKYAQLLILTTDLPT